MQILSSDIMEHKFQALVLCLLVVLQDFLPVSLLNYIETKNNKKLRRMLLKKRQQEMGSTVLLSISAFSFSLQGKVSKLLHQLKQKNKIKKILWQSDSPEQSSWSSWPNFCKRETRGQVYVTAVAENKLLCQEAVFMVSNLCKAIIFKRTELVGDSFFHRLDFSISYRAIILLLAQGFKTFLLKLSFLLEECTNTRGSQLYRTEDTVVSLHCLLKNMQHKRSIDCSSSM